MAIPGNPAVHSAGQGLHPRKKDDSAEYGPTLPSVDERARHRYMSRSPLTIWPDPLDRLLAFVAGEAQGLEVERLPRTNLGTSANSSLDEAHTSRAEGAVTVEHEKRAFHTHSVPGRYEDGHCAAAEIRRQAPGSEPMTGSCPITG